MEAELIVDAKAELGEGPVWHAEQQVLYWVDIEAGHVHIHDPQGNADRVFDVGERVGVAMPRDSGGMVVATDTGFHAFELETESRTPIVDPESHLPDNRFNDGVCDPAGRFWAGTMNLARQPKAAALYVLDTDHSVRRVIDGVTTSNGTDWSPDGSTMYYIDTPTMQVMAYDFDVSAGTISNGRVAIQFPDGIGRPDGMTVDVEGMLWIAHWEGGRVTRWNPAGAELLQTIQLPADSVTSCAFGGPNLDRLYITTARYRLDAERLASQPHAGGLFAVTPGVTGLPSHGFGG